MADVLITEIEQQPDAVLACASGLESQLVELERVAAFVNARQGAPLVLTGMGTSYDALDAFAGRLARRGIAAHAINTAELINFRLPMLIPGSAVIVVSQSGESAEVVRLAEHLAARPGVFLASVTNVANSTLSRRSDAALYMNAGIEQGPTTKSIQTTMVVLSALEHVIAEGMTPEEAVTRVSDLASALSAVISEILMRRHSLVARLREWLGDSSSAWLLARGAGIAAAETAALVLKEAAHQVATAMDSSEFRHGPFELAGPGLAVAQISVEASVTSLDDELLADLASHGTRVIQLGPRSGSRPWPTIGLPLTGSLLDVGLAVVPFQLLIWSLAVERMPEPGRFIRGAKTTTKE